MSNQWQENKRRLNNFRDLIQSYTNNTLPSDINLLKISMANYIKKGGVSQNPGNDADYNEMMRLYNKINMYKSYYRYLNTATSNQIKEISAGSDMGKILQENGEMQSHVSGLEVKLKESEDDVKSAELRDELLRTKDGNITKHQVFMLGRPLRPSSIPYLWALSILFIGASLLVFQTQGPPLLVPLLEWYSMSESGSFFTGSKMWMILSGALAIVILFLSLRVANVI
jgi:hypothetical protein